MKIEPDRSKLQIEPDKPDYAKEIAEKTSTPNLDQDSMEQFPSDGLFAQPYPVKDERTQRLLDVVEEKNAAAAQEDVEQIKTAQSSGGGAPVAKAAEEESKTKTTYKIIDSSFGKQPVVIDGDGEVPDDLRDLGLYEGGKDIISGDWYLHKRNAIREASGDLGTIYAHNQFQAGGIQGRIFYTGEASLEDLTLKGGIGAEAKVEVVGAYAEIGYKTPAVNIAGRDVALGVKLDVDFSVGAQGFGIVEASIGKDTYVELRGELFAGLTYTIEGEAEVGEYADAHAGMDFYVGVGMKGGVNIGFEDGEVNVDVEGGIAVGYGAGFDVGVGIDVVEIGKTLYDLGDGGLEAAGTFGNAVGGFAGVAGDTFQDYAEALADFAAENAESAAEAAEEFIDEAAETAEEAGEAVEEFVEDTAEAAGEAGETVYNAVSDAFDW